MQNYHNPASAGNTEGLSIFAGLPLFDYRPASPDHRDGFLTPGGAVIFRRTRRPPSTCNAIAAIAGLGRED
jgi:hypothetical protein